MADFAKDLPDPDTIRRLCQTLATLDAVLSPDWELRYYSFNNSWSADEQMASMRNGSGDEFSIVFTNYGTFIRGFDHESDLSPFVESPAALRLNIPQEVAASAASAVLTEPSFALEGVPLMTIFGWRFPSEIYWNFATPLFEPLETDGGAWLFDLLVAGPEAYVEFADSYFERRLDVHDVREVYEHHSLTPQLATRLNADVDFLALTEDLAEIGYPVAAD